MKNNKEINGENIKNKKISRAKIVLLSLICAIVVLISGFIIYEKATVNNTYYIGEKNLQIPIFVYHNIVKEKSEVEHDYMQTTAETFEKQITGLMDLGYKPISYKDLKKYKDGEIAIPKWSFVVTFDDGCISVYTEAFEIAKKYNIPMVSFVIDDQVGTKYCYNWEQAKEMYDSGLMEIYSHGFSHREYNKESPNTLLNETNKAYNDLRKNLKNDNLLKVFTYPYGLTKDDERALLWNEGYIQNLTDNKINESKNLDLSGLHRCYPLEDSVLKIILKIQYRALRY